MAYVRAQSWLTYATRPDHVAPALVLAHSLRRTGTSRRVGVIASPRLTPKEHSTLRNTFDDIFLLNSNGDYASPKNDSGDREEEVSAKIFAFSLEMFEKAVLLEPNSFLLENSDHIFTRAQGHVAPLIEETGSASAADFFLLTPHKPFAEFLGEQLERQNGNRKHCHLAQLLLNYSNKWAENNHSPLGDIFKEEDAPLAKSVAQLSLSSGQLLKRDSWAPPSIVHFVEGDPNPTRQLQQLESLLSSGQVRLTERAILSVWLQLFSKASEADNRKSFGRFGEDTSNEPIAIVGISCRQPGANNLQEFWNLLYAGEESVRMPPDFRWKRDQVVAAMGEKERQTNAGFLATTVDEFDAKFFGVSPKEAVFMDPQTRLLHEVLWESLESAGVDPSSLYGSYTGIYTGSWMYDYKDIVQCSTTAQSDFFRVYMGNSIGAGVARLSFVLGLTGPCIATESGCSSAMVALDMAVKSLRCGETSMALAGGVNLLLHPFTSKIMDYVIAPDGRCKTFDAKADGFGRGEACAFLVLKRQSDALRDRDNIWGLIRGSAVSQEGISRSLGTPTVHCEALAMELALKNAGVRPEQVSFVETHGTGTSVGDPMEVAAIARAYHAKNRKEPLVIGSVKTNIGHTESCSGITGIIKVVLAMRHELIPRHLNLKELNPDVNLDPIPAVIPLEPVPWPKIQGQPRLAGVSSFGITGTDGHVIVQEAPEAVLPRFTTGLERPLHILKMSAKTGNGLEEMIKRHSVLFGDEEGLREPFGDVAYTGNVGRANFDHRAFILASDFKSALEAMEDHKLVRGEVRDSTTTKLCFLFTGQGSQYPGMAQKLYESSPVFQFHFDQCEDLLKKDYNLDIRKVLWGSEAESKEISRTIYSQTGIFVVEYCLLQLWTSWGLQPHFVLGHSLGEFCAAVACGILSFRDALKLVAHRSRLIDTLPRGSMLVLKAGKPEVEQLLGEAKVELDLAALNSEEQTVVAGDTDQMQQLVALAQQKGTKTILLEATHAFHSRHMEPMLQKYRKIAEGITYGEIQTEVQFISGMEGGLKQKLDADYWVRHTREKVNFLTACQTLKEAGVDCYLEMGPQPVLSTFVLQNVTLPHVEQPLVCLPSLRRGRDEWGTILSSLGKLWVAGFKVDWQEYDRPYERKKVDVLPFYPFHRKCYWVEVAQGVQTSIHPLVGAQLSNASSMSIYQNDLNVSSLPYLRDHCIGTRIVFPGAGFTEMCMAAGYAVSHCLRSSLEQPRQPLALENVRIEAPLELKEGKFTRMQTIVELPEGLGETDTQLGFQVRVFHRQVNETELGNHENWVAHASADFIPIVNSAAEVLRKEWSPERVKEIMGAGEPTSMESFYKRIDTVGLKFGETFRSVLRHWSVPQEEFGLDEVVAEVKLPADGEKYLLHPLVIDAMFQTQIVAGVRATKTEALRVPVNIGRLLLFRTLADAGGELLYVHAKWISKESCVVQVCTQNLQPVALMEGVELLETNVKTIQSVLESQQRDIAECWEQLWKPLPSIHHNRAVLGNLLEPVANSPEFQKDLAEACKVTPEDFELNGMVNQLVTMYAYRALLHLGWKPTCGEEVTSESVCTQLGLKAPYLRQLLYFYFTCFRDELQLMELMSPGTWKITQVLYPTEELVSAQIQVLYDKLISVERMVVITRIYENVSKHLPKVLTGEENPLAILFPVEPDQQHLSAENYYLEHPGRKDVMAKTLVHMRHVIAQLRSVPGNDDGKRVIRMLEVGAGTGSLSLVALKELMVSWGPKIEYFYTDISASFFIKAETRMEEFRQQVKFAVFNIEEHPLPQGIPLNYFDMVMATDVLHATKDLEQCIRNLRLVLKPHGLITFTETICQDKGISSVFGLLEGYWRFTDFHRRPHHACVGLEVWRELLLGNGFHFFHAGLAYTDSLGYISAEASATPAYDQFPVLAKVELEPEAAPSEDKVVKEEAGAKVTTVKRWILFSPEEEEPERNLMLKVSDALRGAGIEVTLVYPTTELETEEDPAKSEMYEKLKAGEGEEVTGIIYGWSLRNGVTEQKRLTLPFMHIAKHLINQPRPPRLYVLTKDVLALAEERNVPSPATLHGMAKSLKNEFNELFVRCVDLSSADQWNREVDQLIYEVALCKETKEKERLQVCYRQGRRWEPKFNRAHVAPRTKADLQLPPSTDRYQLVLPESKVINDLEFKTLEEETVPEGELEVRVHAYALNFRDIFAILKPSEEFNSINTVGLDFAGVITRVGPGEEKWKVGDRVFGANFKEVQLPSHMIAGADLILPLPAKMTYAEASTLPAVFATSIYCLVNIAKMKKEDTVLIHTGSGGVGLSAIQLAKHIGARIITTAGSPRKRAYLRSLGLEHVFHSRDTTYEQEILRVTNGRGVDIVLNSLTGPGFKEATLAACANGARFVEMSKLAVWTPEEVKERRPDVEYTIVDLTKLERSKFKELQERTTEYMEKGQVSSIPFVKFDALRLRQALQHFQKAKHIGKVVVTMPEIRAEQGAWKVKVNLFDGDSTYLITGGLGGIGFEVCKWMLQKGATDIVLNGRNPPKPKVQAEIDALNKKAGVNVRVILGDVGDAEQCGRLIEEITGSGEYKPLRGIQHCAGVLMDNLYGNQSWQTFEATFRPKVEGTWNLHRLTAGLNLEHFVLYSSFTALMGTPAQANHSSANCFEDAFAHYRYSLGLPATTINWGQWAQVGCAKEVNVIGVLPVSVHRMLAGLEETLRSQTLQVSYCEFENIGLWTLMVPSFKYYVDERLLKSLNEKGTGDGQLLLQSTKFWAEVDEAEGVEAKQEVVTSYMKAILRNALRMEPDEPIKDDANMQDLGVDSLMLIELRNSIQSLLGSRLSVNASMLKDCQTIRQLATVIVNRIVDAGEEEAANLPPLSAEDYEQLLKEDCVLEEEIRPPEARSGLEPGHIETVLVTGVTGHLGPYLLARLCKVESLKKIICLVRTMEGGTSPQEKLERVLKAVELEVNMSRVECVRGDVAKEHLGLEEALWQRLSAEVDCVVHLAAKSNHVEHYRKVEGGRGRDVRSVNVGGTRNVIRFAVEGRTKSVFYASSLLSIVGKGEEEDCLTDKWPVVEEAKALVESGGHAYPASKFVSEILLKEALDRGVPCKVFRFPWIMGHSKTGRLNFHTNHYILRFLTYLKLKAIPATANFPAVILPVDICADWSVRLFWSEAAPCHAYNVVHPRPQSEVEFVQVAKEQFDTDLELVEWTSKEFVEKMYATDMPLEALKELYQDMDRAMAVLTNDKIQAIQGYINYPDRYFWNARLAQFVPDFEQNLPSTMAVLAKDLNFAKKQGFFAKFGL